MYVPTLVLTPYKTLVLITLSLFSSMYQTVSHQVRSRTLSQVPLHAPFSTSSFSSSSYNSIISLFSLPFPPLGTLGAEMAHTKKNSNSPTATIKYYLSLPRCNPPVSSYSLLFLLWCYNALSVSQLHTYHSLPFQYLHSLTLFLPLRNIEARAVITW